MSLVNMASLHLNNLLCNSYKDFLLYNHNIIIKTNKIAGMHLIHKIYSSHLSSICCPNNAHYSKGICLQSFLACLLVSLSLKQFLSIYMLLLKFSVGKQETWLESLQGGHSEKREECGRLPVLFIGIPT